MRYKIDGGQLPVVICRLDAGESMITEKGAMAWMTPNMHMETQGTGGLGKSLGRMLSGAKFQLYECQLQIGSLDNMGQEWWDDLLQKVNKRSKGQATPAEIAWIDEQFEAGRQAALSNNELETKIEQLTGGKLARL